MQPYYSPQKRECASPLTTSQPYLSLSQNNKPLSLDSPYFQRSSSIDPECLSPLPFSSSKLSTPIKMPDSPQSQLQDSNKSTKGSNLGKKLKVKVFNIFQDKNEVSSFSPIFEEDLPQCSLSTSAASPEYTESKQLKTDTSDFSQSSGGSRPGPPTVERNNSNTIDEFIAQITRSNSLTQEETKTNVENINEIQNVENSASNPANRNAERSQNAEQADVEEAEVEDEDAHTNFVDSLEFILEKTPVITIFMSLISLSLISGIAVSFLEGKNSHRFLFVIVYVFIIYLLIEKTLRMFKSHAPVHPTFFDLIRGEPFYNTLDTIGYLFVAIVADLMLSKMVSSLNSGLYFHLSTLIFYCVCSRVSYRDKAYGILIRGVFILQLVALMYKLDGQLAASWKVVLSSGWIFLAACLVKFFEGTVQIFTAFSGHNLLSIISKTSKVVTSIALVLLFVDLIVLMMILVGVCKVLDLEDQKMDFLKSWLTISQYLNAFLLFFTTIAGADLFEFILTAAEYFNPTAQEQPKQKQIIGIKKETLLLRVSPTYYKILEEEHSEQPKVTEQPLETESAQELNKNEDTKDKGDSDEGAKENEGFEDNTCYICCGKNANGVILDCGHGGICFECLNDYIDKKNECMECRKKITSVLKIDQEIELGKIFKGEDVCKIVEIGQESD